MRHLINRAICQTATALLGALCLSLLQSASAETEDVLRVDSTRSHSAL